MQMKFPKYHHDTVQKLIAEVGLSLPDFSFIKRKGWIHLVHKPREKSLAYFNKKETHLNIETQDWEHSSYFKIKIDKEKEYKVDNIDLLFVEIKRWLKTL